VNIIWKKQAKTNKQGGLSQQAKQKGERFDAPGKYEHCNHNRNRQHTDPKGPSTHEE
jgi:hypothetical protein